MIKEDKTVQEKTITKKSGVSNDLRFKNLHFPGFNPGFEISEILG